MACYSDSTLPALRAWMTKQGWDAYYLTINDPHLSEYVSEHYEIIRWITGFTGSAAQLVITQTSAFLWVDSRYWVQAADEVDENITVMRAGSADLPDFHDWLKALNENTPLTLGVNDELLSANAYDKLQTCVAKISCHCASVFKRLWSDRPPRIHHRLFIHQASTESAKAKLACVQAALAEQAQATGVEKAALFLSKLDDIAWLTNLRGQDIAYNPVFYAWALIRPNKAKLFVNTKMLDKAVLRHLIEAGWKVDEYFEIDTAIDKAVQKNRTIFMDKANVSAWYWRIAESKARDWAHPIALWKSVKTPEEIEGLKVAMKRDGEAIEAFIADLKDKLAKGKELTEWDAAKLLHRHRAQCKNFITESFETIAAVNENAALPHYAPTKATAKRITPPCVLLVDSGAHYLEGTTDTTRVWFLGNTDEFDAQALEQLKTDYTAVYNGMKALSEAVFEVGTCGKELDAIARSPVQAIGADYGHGTGHGIGLTLNVHETPPTISPRETTGTLTPLQPGMVMSDEPGIYREGQWGIRLENTLVCVGKEDGKLGFEVLTQCAFDETLLRH